MKDKHDECRPEKSDKLADAIVLLTAELHCLRHDKQTTILDKLVELEIKIMSAISDFSARVNTKFDAVSASVDSIVTSQAGITADVAALKALIEQLQNNPGPITPEDQTLLDAAEAKLDTLTTKTQAVADALKALDDATTNPPTP